MIAAINKTKEPSAGANKSKSYRKGKKSDLIHVRAGDLLITVEWWIKGRIKNF